MDNFLVQSCASDNDNLTDFFRGLRRERRRRNELKTNEHSLPSKIDVLLTHFGVGRS